MEHCSQTAPFRGWSCSKEKGHLGERAAHYGHDLESEAVHVWDQDTANAVKPKAKAKSSDTIPAPSPDRIDALMRSNGALEVDLVQERAKVAKLERQNAELLARANKAEEALRRMRERGWR